MHFHWGHAQRLHILLCSLQSSDTSGVRMVQLLLALLPPDMAPWRLCLSPATQDEDAFKVQITWLTVTHTEIKLSSYIPPCFHNNCYKIPSMQVYCSLRPKSSPQLGWQRAFCSFKRFICFVYTCTGFAYKPFIFRLTLSASKGSTVRCC